MKRVMGLMIFLFSVLLAVATSVNWNLNPEQSVVNFKIKNFGKHVDGNFKGMQAKIKFDKENPMSSEMEATVDVNTIDTGIKKRDKDLKSAEYFDAATYPQIRFKSTGFAKNQNNYVAYGNLTIKDVTKQVEIPFTFEESGDHGVFKGTLSLDRLDYHVGGKSRILGDRVDVEIVAEVNSLPKTSMK